MTNNEIQIIDGLSSDEYHAGPEISNSKLSEFLDNSELYYCRYVAKTLPLRAQTPAMSFGSLFHDAVLLGLDSQAVEVPASVLTKDGKRAGTAFKDFAIENAGKSLLLAEEYQRLRNMTEEVFSHPMASRLLDLKDSAVEQSIYWTDEATGLRLRCRPDVRRLSMPLLVDLKTTSDVSRKSLASSMYDFGYCRQAPLYKEGVKAATRLSHDFVFVFVEKEAPHRVRCYELDGREERAMQKGYEDFRAGLDRLAEAYKTNRWEEPGWDQVLTLDLPNWAYSNQWELTNGYGD